MKATMDGRNAKREIASLEGSLSSFADKMGGTFRNKLLSFFSVTAVTNFARSVDSAVMRVAEMMDRIRSGRSIPGAVDEAQRSNMGEQRLGFASAYGAARQRFSGLADRAMVDAARLATVIQHVSGFGTGGVMARSVFGDREWMDMVNTAISPQAGAARFRADVEAGNAESERLSTIDFINREETRALTEAEEQAVERQRSFEASFQPPPAGRYFGPGFAEAGQVALNNAADRERERVALERRQLHETRRLVEALNRVEVNGSMFP